MSPNLSKCGFGVLVLIAAGACAGDSTAPTPVPAPLHVEFASQPRFTAIPANGDHVTIPLAATAGATCTLSAEPVGAVVLTPSNDPCAAWEAHVASSSVSVDSISLTATATLGGEDQTATKVVPVLFEPAIRGISVSTDSVFLNSVVTVSAHTAHPARCTASLRGPSPSITTMIPDTLIPMTSDRCSWTFRVGSAMPVGLAREIIVTAWDGSAAAPPDSVVDSVSVKLYEPAPELDSVTTTCEGSSDRITMFGHGNSFTSGNGLTGYGTLWGIETDSLGFRDDGSNPGASANFVTPNQMYGYMTASANFPINTLTWFWVRNGKPGGGVSWTHVALPRC